MYVIYHEKVAEYAQTLRDKTCPIENRVSSLFNLKVIASLEAIDALI